MELHAFHQTVLAGLGYGQIAALQNIVEGYGGCTPSDDCHTLNALRLIFLIALLCHSVNTGSQTVNQDLACRIGFDRLLDSVAFHREGDALHLSILRSLFQTNGSGRCFHIQIGAHTIRIFYPRNQILPPYPICRTEKQSV